MKDMKTIGFLFLHGAGLRGEVWKRTAEGIGAPYLLADFPLRDGAPPAIKELELHSYTQFILEQVNAWGQDRFVIVAHSISGILVPELCRVLGDRVAGLVAIGAAIADRGGSFLSALPFARRMIFAAVISLLGTKPPESALRSGLCNDLTSEQAAELVEHFVPEAPALFKDRCGAVMPPLLPSMYVKLLKDQEIAPGMQDRMAGRLGQARIAELSTGHLPMLSDPAGLRRLLLEFLDRHPTT
jgi:pimeloyl-ACP methyl ester carboxylesterase